MSVYVGIDVHRKRSQVAVIDSGGEVLANRNVPNGTETILGVIGGLPPGTPTAFEAAFGWGWLLELLEDYGFDPHLVHPLQCKAIASARSSSITSRETADDLALIDALQVPIDRLDAEVRQRARSDPRVKILTQLPGVGTFTALVILAEVVDITPFGSARKLASWAGLTPTVRGSDRTVRHGHLSKQGPALP